MALPGVSIEISDGNLGGFNPTGDGVAGLICTAAVVASRFALGTSYQLFSLKELGNRGVTTANNPLLYRHVSDFYLNSGDGAELWVMGVAANTAMEAMVDPTKTAAPKLLDTAAGGIRLLAISSKAKQSETLSGGISDEVDAAATKAQLLAQKYTDKQQPVQIILDGKAWNGTAGDLKNYRGDDKNRVSVLLSAATENSKNASVGVLLGQLAKLPVQRKVSRVKNGSLPIDTAVFTDTQSIETHADALGSIHDKGYIFFRTYEGRAGYFFSDDPTATAGDSDLSYIVRNRVLDKARLIAYDVYVDEIGDEVSVDPKTGYLAAVAVKALQVAITSRIETQMVSTGEAVAVSCMIDEKQDIQTSGKLEVQLRIVPHGYLREIVVKLGFAKSV